ncbi:MAG: hypothetical protein U9Q71_06060 [Pseudomonadota bacterium]|nr:hypothetical protein [Pseudomonadota bacterium]
MRLVAPASLVAVVGAVFDARILPTIGALRRAGAAGQGGRKGNPTDGYRGTWRSQERDDGKRKS